MVIRKTFPQVYKFVHCKSGKTYFQLSARSKRWGMDERKTFETEKEALDYARQIEKQIDKSGAHPAIPKEVKIQASAYGKLVEHLTPFGKTPEEAVDHYVKFLGEEIIRQVKPTVGQLVEQFQTHKFLEKVDEQYKNEIKVHCRFIKRTWGHRKIDELRKNEIDVTLTKSHPVKNTRRKYLTFVRMFFKWVLGEDKDYIVSNPTEGITYKPERFEKNFYQPDTLKTFFRQVAKEHPHLIGYYAVLTFCGLRPSEGARVQWHHVNFNAKELHVVHGKTDARHIHLESVLVAWLKWYKDKSPKDSPFVPQSNMQNLEKRARATMSGKWIPDGLRHTFATYFSSLKKDYPAVAWYMGNSVGMIKKHYAQSIPSEQLNEFWNLTPENVMADKPDPKSTTVPSR